MRQNSREGAAPWHLVVLLGLLASGVYNLWRWRSDRCLVAKHLRRSSPPPPDQWRSAPRVSVLVAAWNEADHIDRHVRSFVGLRYPNRELILCAGGTDDTYARAAHWTGPQVKVLEQCPGEGKQRALRRCFAIANGEVIYLTDADCVLDDDSFERLVFPIAQGLESACSGSSRPYSELSRHPFVVSQIASQCYSALHSPLYAAGLLGRNCAVTRELLRQSGGLDAPAPTGTDYVLAKCLARAGARIRQIPDSRVQTDYPTTASEYLRQQRRWLRNVVARGKEYGAIDEVRSSLLTSGVGVAMITLPFLALVIGPMALGLWVLLLGHAFLGRIRYMFVARAYQGLPITPGQIGMIVPLLILDFVAWARPLLDYVFKKGQDTW